MANREGTQGPISFMFLLQLCSEGRMHAGRQGRKEVTVAINWDLNLIKKIKHQDFCIYLQQGSPNMQTETFNLHLLTQENVKCNIKWFNKKIQPSLFRLLLKSAPKSAFIPSYSVMYSLNLDKYSK